MASIVSKPRKDGSISFQVYVRVKGSAAITKTFGCETQARTFAEAAERLARAKAVEKAKETLRPKPPTSVEFLNEPLRETLRHFLASPRASKKHKKCSPSLLRHVGGARICEWRDSWVDAYVRKMREKISRAGRPFTYDSIVEHLNVIRVAVQWRATELGFPLPTPPNHLRGFPPGWSVRRSRRLSAAEEIALFATLRARTPGLGRHYRLLVKLALETGARMQELLRAEWAEFEIERQVWNLPREHTKCFQDRAVPLSKRAARVVRVLWMLRREGDPRVFHPISGTPAASSYFNAAVRDSGFKDFRFHDLRHEAISRMVLHKRKMSVFEIMALVGHASLVSFTRYANLRGDELALRMD